MFDVVMSGQLREPLLQRACVDWAVRAQGADESLEGDGAADAPGIGMHIGAPSSKSRPLVDDEPKRLDGEDDADQIRLWAAIPTSEARPRSFGGHEEDPS